MGWTTKRSPNMQWPKLVKYCCGTKNDQKLMYSLTNLWLLWTTERLNFVVDLEIQSPIETEFVILTACHFNCKIQSLCGSNVPEIPMWVCFEKFTVSFSGWAETNDKFGVAFWDSGVFTTERLVKCQKYWELLDWYYWFLLYSIGN